jgi:DNA-binding response OmpR family regulator
MQKCMKILIVEDDRALNRGIGLVFERDGFEIKQAFDIQSAKEILAVTKPDLLILDVNLPDGNGMDFCRDIRAGNDVPIIMLTANDMETDIVTGFELGCDDYITKPFSLAVLRARVGAVLRRKSGSDSRITIGELTLDFDRVEFSKAGKPFTLSRTEQKLLRKFTANRGMILTREVLMESLYANESEYVDENALSVIVNRLRSKIEDNPQSPQLIKTVYGLGYVWSGGSTQ